MEQIYTKKRILEIDFIRGIAFIFMALDHLIYDLGDIFRSQWSIEGNNNFLVKITDIAYHIRQSPIVDILRIALASGLFLIISGIVSNFSRSNIKRGVKLGVVALILSFITWLITIIANVFFNNDINIIIVFGILHSLALCMILTPLINKLNNRILIFIALLVLVIGFSLNGKRFDSPVFLVIFNIIPKGFFSADFYPIIPYIGFYIIGIIIGRIFYKEKKSLFEKDIKIEPINFFGRNALILYFAHQILIFAFLFLIGIIFI